MSFLQNPIYSLFEFILVSTIAKSFNTSSDSAFCLRDLCSPLRSSSLKILYILRSRSLRLSMRLLISLMSTIALRISSRSPFSLPLLNNLIYSRKSVIMFIISVDLD